MCFFRSFLDAEGVCRWGTPAAQWSALLIEWNLWTELPETDFGFALASQGGVKTPISLRPHHSIYTQLISDSLAAIGLPQPSLWAEMKSCIGLNSYMFNTDHFLILSWVYFCLCWLFIYLIVLLRDAREAQVSQVKITEFQMNMLNASGRQDNVAAVTACSNWSELPSMR